MGAQLVAAAYTFWTHLPDKPFRLLVKMALTVKDADQPPIYWGGRDALAEALGMPGTTRDDDGRATFPKATRSAIDRCIGTLTAAGAIERVKAPTFRRRAEYRLELYQLAPGTTADTDPSQGPTPAEWPGPVTTADEHRLALVRARADQEATG